MTESPPSSKIAVIGIGCRLPGGASDYESFWHNLIEGKSAIIPTPATRYDAATLASRDKSKPGRLVGGRGGYIDGFDEFEPAFFGISPREADYMDPQQRKLLEVAWEALEDGGQRPSQLAGGRPVGVFIGAFTLDYKIVQFADLGFTTLAAHTATGTMMTMVSNRISYCLDLRGPSMSVDTACSSSLVAVDLACQSLRRGESSLALAGGVLLHMTPQYTIAETKGGFLSPAGRSCPFDAAADGYVRAEGAGVIALKRLPDALRDGDPVHAVIIGSGISQDGRTGGITVPSPAAQAELIERVCAEAGITPGDLQYVEAHGTSTPVGDPAEARALSRALAVGRRAGARCYVGSVKANIGHAEAAAGIAGLVKTILCLKHRTIPPQINLERLSPQIEAAGLPYEFPVSAARWPEHDGPARAGVSSFGFGGTNAHVLLEEAPPAPAAPGGERACTVLPLTARDPAALPDLAAGILRRLATAPDPVADLGHTLARRRDHHESRLSVVYSCRATLTEALDAYLRGEAHPRVLEGRQRDPAQRRLAWVFTGMGPQWWAMGRQLFETEPAYRAAVQRCAAEIARLTGWSLTDHLAAGEADSQMAQTWLAQPANFALQVGLAELWRQHGVQPDAVVGHSTGEAAAFYVAGVYSLADAVKIIVHRSRLQHRLAGTGTMLAVSMPPDEAERRVRGLGGAVSVAACNSPGSVTLAGDARALARLAGELTAEQVFARLLDVEVPYHSAGMDLIKDELLAALDGLAPRAARLPVYLTGRDGRADGPELDAGYWWDNVRGQVRFRQAIGRLAADGYRVFLEIGPHPVLGHAIRECLAADGADGLALPSIRRQEDEPERFMMSLAALHNLGAPVAWDVLQPAGQPARLPRYPWRRDRYWTAPEQVERVRLGQADHPLLGRRLASAEPAWEVSLDAEHLPWLADHRIQGAVLFPAAGYVEMAIAAARALAGGGPAVLTDLQLRSGLFLPDGQAAAVQLSVCLQSAAFTIASLPAGRDRDPVRHATGVVQAGRPRRPGPLDAAAITGRSAGHLDRDACYAGLTAMGYHYGPAFRGIEEAWTGPGEALARIRLPEPAEPADPADPAGPAADYHVHPALLDACFQALLATQLAGAPPLPGVLLPVSIGEVSIEALGRGPVLAHATVSHRDDGELTGDIAIYDAAGEFRGRIGALRAAAAEQAAAAASLATMDTWLADLTWLGLPPAAAGEPGWAARDWLVFADAGGVADELAAALRAAGGCVHLVRPAGGYQRGGPDRPWTVAPGSAADMRRLLADLRVHGGQPPPAIAHLWNLDAPRIGLADRAALDGFTETGPYSLIALAQALADAPPGGALHIVTRGTQAAAARDAAEPLGAAAWGIGRVLRYQELPGWPGKLIDLDGAPGPAGAVAAGLLDELSRPDEDEIAIRGGRRYTSRLVPAAGLTRPLPLRLRPDGSYLVTGAFGALGRLTCRALARRGARRIILASRSPLPPRARWHDLAADSAAGRNARFVTELEALGAEAVLMPVDVTDERALAAWLDGYRRRGCPPVRGVFHLAGQVRDTLLADLDRPGFDAAYDPKVTGAWLLHRLLADEPLDYFVLFASIASLLPTAGQANYAAGNAVLDALAQHRRARGLPALSIDWGPWATGMIEELGLTAHYREARGMRPLAPDAGIAVLERVLGQDRAQLAVPVVADWPAFLAWYPAAPRLVTELAAAAAASTPAPADEGFAGAFRAAGEAGRRSLLTERFTALAAASLRMSAADLGPGDSLSALGLDSLLAMELRARVQAELGTALPLVTLMSGAPVAEIVARLHEDLAALVTGETADPGGAGDPGEAGDGTPVEIFGDEAEYPLTQNQKALWFLRQLNPDGFAYNIGGAVEVAAELDPGLMFAAVRRLAQRHPSLRAGVAVRKGQPVQVIRAALEPDLGLVDVQGRDWDDVYQMIIAEYRRPYDLEGDPLFRFRLYQRAPDRWVIMKAVHHIISDAVSTFTFIEELFALYEELRHGRPAALPPVPARYLDFLNHQARFLSSPRAGRMLDYWRGHLPAEIPPLDLPADKARPAVMTNNGASEFFQLGAELSARVRALAHGSDLTPFMVLLGAYYLLLHRYSGQDDIVVGSPVTGRTSEEFASVYGYFANPLPLHVSLAGEPSVAELLGRVRATVLGGLDNQEYPFVLLAQQLGQRHDPSRSAIFQTMFILLTHRVATERHGYRLEYIELPEEEGQFDLTLSAYEDEADRRFHCVLKYNTDLLLPGTAAQLVAHYVRLLDALTRAPLAAPASGLDLLDEAERERILGEWSGAGRPAAPGAPVHQLISAVAAARPGAVAVAVPAAAGGGRLTYAELDRDSRRLARRLRALGVRDGAVVALCLEKSPELVTAVLAVLRAGGAYLPLDPEHPAGRLAGAIRGAAAAVVIAGAASRDKLAGLPVPLLAPGDTRSADDKDDGGEDAAVRWDAPAYVVQTSGSTGTPKLVEVSHRSLAAAYAAWRQEYRLDTAVSVHLQLASPSFDVFTGDLVRALCSGGTLVLVGRDLLFDTARLHEVMIAERADCAEFVPATIRGLITYCERTGRRLDFMRLVIVGSDAWKVAEYHQLQALCGPGTRVVNSYGLSEATIDSSYAEGPLAGLEPSRMVPVGRPFPNTELYILDRRGEPVPPGVTGELWVGGSGVAAGYRGDPAQTAERFVVRELAGRPVRLYRTGDLARWDSDGCVHLAGRADSQVKVHGHRVDTGEIESLLTRWPAIGQAVVAARRDEHGDGVLRAYVVPAAGAAVDRPGLRRYLAGQLPSALIPTFITELPELPLTASGKVDTQSLPPPGRGDGAAGGGGAPATHFESRMAARWKELTGAGGVAAGDDFFEIGGTSVMLMELVYQLQSEFGVTVPVSALFRATTLQGMAAAVAELVLHGGSGAQPCVRFNPGRPDAIFCFPPAGGHGLVYRQLAGHLAELECVAFNYLPGADKVARYADLIESGPPAGPPVLLGYSLGGNLAFEVARELEGRGRAVRQVIIIDAVRISEPFAPGHADLEPFERELGEHLRKHTGSAVVTAESMRQARDYIRFCAGAANLGRLAAPITVIPDEHSAAAHAAGQPGSWHGSSAATDVLAGSGAHADMLDQEHAARNADLIRVVLTGAAADGG